MSISFDIHIKTNTIILDSNIDFYLLFLFNFYININYNLKFYLENKVIRIKFITLFSTSALFLAPIQTKAEFFIPQPILNLQK